MTNIRNEITDSILKLSIYTGRIQHNDKFLNTFSVHLGYRIINSCCNQLPNEKY